MLENLPYRGRLLALPSIVRPGWKSLQETGQGILKGEVSLYH